MRSDTSSGPRGDEPRTSSNRADRVVEVLIGTHGASDHPDVALTRLLINLEDADDAALVSALEELTANEDPHRG